MEPRWQRVLRRTRRASRLPAWAGVALVGAGFAALAIWVQPSDGGDPELPPEFAAEPDAYVEDGDIRQFRPDGSLHFRLRARRISYFEGDTAAELERPELELHDAAGPPWRLTAASGEMRSVPEHRHGVEDSAEGGAEGEEQVVFRGAVRLRQDRDDGFTEITTEELVLYPQRQLARADQPVAIATPARRVTAAGLDANLQSGHMTLFSSPRQRVAIVADSPHGTL